MEQLRGMHDLYRLCTKVNPQGMRFANHNKNKKIWKKVIERRGVRIK
jgi:hypothetical protein